jgi:hypothetical protein
MSFFSFDALIGPYALETYLLDQFMTDYIDILQSCIPENLYSRHFSYDVVYFWNNLLIHSMLA